MSQSDAASAAERRQSPAEVTPTDAVDDKVQRRVGRHDQVAEVEVVEVGVATLVVGLGEEVVQQLIDVSRSLRHQEDDDNDEHNQRDVVAFTAVVRVHLDAA